MSQPESIFIKYISSIAAQPPSTATRERVAHALLDWFTAGWAAKDNPRATNLFKLAERIFCGNGTAPVFAGDRTLSTAGAAFANAGITHICEIDDAHRAAMLHPGIVTISPVLALASKYSITYNDLINSIVVGYEVALRTGAMLGPGHSGNFHATATAGTLGAAAAAAIALKCNQTQLHNALGIAATQAAGLWQMLDDGAYESKPLHPAFAVRNGITAAHAAKLDFQGARAFISGNRGLYALLKGNGPLELLQPQHDELLQMHTVTIKAWPCCAQLFTPLDATQVLMERHQFKNSDIESIHIDIFPHALKIANVFWPTSSSEAAFSIRYLISLLLINKRVSLRDVESESYMNEELISLSQLITVTAKEEYQKHYPNKRISQVSISLKDGRKLTEMRELRRGDPEDPFDWDTLYIRMREFAFTLSDGQADKITEWCDSFTSDHNGNLPCRPPHDLFQDT